MLHIWKGTQHEIEVEFAFQFNDGYSETIFSFVNNVRTRDGGTHETGAKTAITRVFNEYARKIGLLKEKDKNLRRYRYSRRFICYYFCSYS